MRQIGSLPNEADAQRFAAHLITLGIHAHAEHDDDGWAIWVRDENQLDSAVEELKQFRLDPQASRYQRAFQQAENIQRDEQQRRDKARKNVVEMRGRWSRGFGGGGSTPRRAPLVFVMIGISVLVYLLTEQGDMLNDTTQQLLFAQPQVQGQRLVYPQNGFQQIAQGQIWRVVTPIFLHFDVTHIVFDMWILYVFGSQVEDRRGTARFGLLVLLIAVVSNLGQYLYGDYLSASPVPAAAFGGMSGVDFGLFGYIWIKSRFQPSAGFRLSTFNVIIMFGWLLLCIFREAGASSLFFVPDNIANAAHGVGFLVGVIVAYVPILKSHTD